MPLYLVGDVLILKNFIICLVEYYLVSWTMLFLAFYNDHQCSYWLIDCFLFVLIGRYFLLYVNSACTICALVQDSVYVLTCGIPVRDYQKSWPVLELMVFCIQNLKLLWEGIKTVLLELLARTTDFWEYHKPVQCFIWV